jgi:ATP-dependent protease ClpP protease subunit
MDEDISSAISVVTVTSQIYNFHLDSEMLEPENYREIFDILREANENDLINIFINSIGGDLVTFIEFYNLIINSKARIVGYLYMAYSSAALLALSLPELVLTEFCSFLIHAPSGFAEGKVGDIKNHGEFFDGWCKEIMGSVLKGFLSDKEFEKVMDGTELWLNKKEIEKRLINRDKLTKRK